MEKIAEEINRPYINVRGTSDFSSPQTNLFNNITNTAREIFRVYGYNEIILPILEEERIFKRGLGDTTDIVEKQMFKIEDKDIVLRPEGTAQIIRYYLGNSLYKQADFHKLFYIGPMFRGERPQKGRLRQFHHIGVEAIGSNSYYLDVEIIILILKILSEIGVRKKELKINTLGCIEDKKRFSEGLYKKLLTFKDKLCDDCQRRIEKNPLRVFDCKTEKCKQITLSLVLNEKYLCTDCNEHFKNILNLLNELSIPYTHSPKLVRGLDYYTNTVFEITSDSLGAQDALGGGGRYNNLIRSMGGPDIPAIGFALGIERIMLTLTMPENKEKIDIFIAVIGEGLFKEGFNILRYLRQRGDISDMDYCGKSLKSQLRLAQKKNARFVVIVGEEEWKEKKVILKDMEKGGQEIVKYEDLLSKKIGSLLC